MLWHVTGEFFAPMPVRGREAAPFFADMIVFRNPAPVFGGSQRWQDHAGADDKMDTTLMVRGRPKQMLLTVWPCFVLLIAAGLALGSSVSVHAQAPVPDALKQRDQELDTLREQQRQAADMEKRLRQEIDALGDDRRKMNQALIDTATRIRTVEAQVVEAEARINPLTDRELSIRKSLDARRAVIAEVLAALQRIGHRPPPALLVKPEDALEAVRTAVMFGALLPEMRTQAESLSKDLAELVHLREQIAQQRHELQRDLTEQSQNQLRLTALFEQRKQQQGDAQKALEGERQRIALLARQADSLKDLIAKLEQNLDPATRNARVAARSAAEGKDLGETRGDLTALRDPGRLSPAIAFSAAKGTLAIPVNGVKIRDFGSPDSNGGTEKGVSIATRAGAQVTSPCDGWVVYAGAYRSYGQVLIMNVGGGYHVLLTGMEQISVDPGQFVLAGEPVAVMGRAPQAGSALAAGSSQPILYIEFRKDGTPVDPTPWWTPTENEKVRG
jgi:murein hydrolase activator